jgi:hypothetical protein
MELENIILNEVSQAQKTKIGIWTLDLGQMQQCCCTWAHAKGRAYTGGMGICRKPKT